MSGVRLESETVEGPRPVEAVFDPSTLELTGGGLTAVRDGGRRVPVRAARAKEKIFVWCEGETFEFSLPVSGHPRPHGTSADAGLRAPMPGKVLKILVQEGESVPRGQTLLVLEAMKMEHEIKAPADGRVVLLPFHVGDQVEAGVELIRFEG